MTPPRRGKSRRDEDDQPAFPGGGYQDHTGLWHTDHRTVGQARRDAILKLLLIFGGPWIVLGLILAVASWLT